MKLATYKDGSRDGQLVLVSRDGQLAHYATGIATRLQQVLDDWNFLSPQLQDLTTTLNQGKARHAFAFDPRLCMAPLPRAYQWLQAAPWAADQLALAQRAADHLLGPCDEARFAADDTAIDCGASLAVLCAELPQGSDSHAALDAVRLLLLANDWALPQRPGVPPATAFAPLAVTPDELGSAWLRGGRVGLNVDLALNGRRLGLLDAGAGQRHAFADLLALAASARTLGSGSLVGGGVLGSDDADRGVARLADKRQREQAQGPDGSARSPWLQPGDRLRIDCKGSDGHSVFGAIEQAICTAPVR